MLTTQLRYGHVTDQMKRESSARMESYIKDVLNLQRVKQRVFPLKKVKEKAWNHRGSRLSRWRRRRDLNPRDGFPPYSLSRGAPSATWVLLRAESNIDLEQKCGGESGIRTHGCLRIAGFQDRFLQPLGHLSTSDLRSSAKVIIPYFFPSVNLSCAISSIWMDGWASQGERRRKTA